MNQTFKDNRYRIVVAAARRARQLLCGEEPLVFPEHVKPVTIALEEIKAGKVSFVRRQTSGQQNNPDLNGE